MSRKTGAGHKSWKLVVSKLTVAMSLTGRLSQFRAPWGIPGRLLKLEKGDPQKKIMGMLSHQPATPQCKKRLRARTENAERTFANFRSCHVDFLFTIIAELSSPFHSSFQPFLLVGHVDLRCRRTAFQLNFIFYESSSAPFGASANQWNIIELITSSRRKDMESCWIASYAPCIGAT